MHGWVQCLRTFLKPRVRTCTGAGMRTCVHAYMLLCGFARLYIVCLCVCVCHVDQFIDSASGVRLQFGYGFELCDANSPRNVENTNPAKLRPAFLTPLLLVGSKDLVLKVPKQGEFHVAIRVTI